MWTPKEQGGGDDPGHGYYDSIEAAQAAAEAHWAAACNTAPDLLAEVIRLRAREAAGSVLLASVEDVTHGRGMFGINAGDDLDWAISHLEAAITRYHALNEAPPCPPQT